MPPRQNNRGSNQRSSNQSSGPKKTLYHSELQQMGDVRVTVKSDVLQSKYQGKPPYVILLIDGQERNYTLDNDECESFFDGQKGQTFWLKAVGDRDNHALEYLGDDEAPPPQEQQQAPPQRQAPTQQRQAPQHQQAPPTQQRTNRPPAPEKPTTDQAIVKARVAVAQALTLEKICDLATAKFAIEWQARHGMPMAVELYTSTKARLFMEAKGMIRVSDLPVDYDYVNAGKAKADAGPKAPPQKQEPPPTKGVPPPQVPPQPPENPEPAQPVDEDVPF